MPTHAEKRLLPYAPEQVYEVVAAVDRYPEFLPWCKAARITRRDGNSFEAELVIAFKMFRERFISKVQLTPKSGVDVQYVDGPFRYLNNHWRFLPAPDGGCVVDFYVDFEFRSKVLQGLIGLLLTRRCGGWWGRSRGGRTSCTGRAAPRRRPPRAGPRPRRRAEDTASSSPRTCPW
jgi:coenzyme Q-binding protein COQ10